MKLFIHDLEVDDAICLKINTQGFRLISANQPTAYCQGCFNCWFKTPGECYIKDSLKHIGGMIGRSEEVIIISENYYGGYSTNVKRLLDRSISTSLPFVTYRKKQLHHRVRHKNDLTLTVLLYGDFTTSEREVAEAFVKANGVNMGCKDTRLFIIEDRHQIGEVLDEHINSKW